MATVDTEGVRCRPWILEKDFGIALYTDIESVVLAVGRIVVWVEAAAEVSTIRTSRRERTAPIPVAPKMALPSTERTSPMFAGLPRPEPFVPPPATLRGG